MPPGGFITHPKLGAVTTGARVTSREDSHPQVILKLQHPSSLDYKACHGLPVLLKVILLRKFILVFMETLFLAPYPLHCVLFEILIKKLDYVRKLNKNYY